MAKKKTLRSNQDSNLGLLNSSQILVSCSQGIKLISKFNSATIVTAICLLELLQIKQSCIVENLGPPVTNIPAGDIKVISLAAEPFKNGVKQPQYFIELIKGSR